MERIFDVEEPFGRTLAKDFVAAVAGDFLTSTVEELDAASSVPTTSERDVSMTLSRNRWPL